MRTPARGAHPDEKSRLGARLSEKSSQGAHPREKSRRGRGLGLGLGLETRPWREAWRTPLLPPAPAPAPSHLPFPTAGKTDHNSLKRTIIIDFPAHTINLFPNLPQIGKWCRRRAGSGRCRGDLHQPGGICTTEASSNSLFSSADMAFNPLMMGFST